MISSTTHTVTATNRTDASLITHDLGKSMGTRTLWSNLNLHCHPGELIALTGESGCGKTTLLNILGLLERPSTGTITYGDQTLTNCSPRVVRLMHRNVMGFMFQNYALVEQWTVKRNLLLALRSIGAPLRSRNAIIRKALRQVHMERYANRLVYTLSGGEQQRIAIARLLIRSPHIVLADEPTAALDIDNRSMVMGHLRSFADAGSIVIYTTHNQEDADAADQVITL